MVTGSSIRRLDIGYLDLYLEHQALNDYFAAWRAMGGGRYSPFDDEGFKAIAEAHGKTVGQV